MTHTAQVRPLYEIAQDLGLGQDDLIPYGQDKAKLAPRFFSRTNPQSGRLILVSAINPTPAGEGKTTTAIGLQMGLQRIGKKACLALREPSLGPVFGVKGGGTGGG
ncbi:MAG TPA: formate--tetrahydrofolate ligase, partial [Pseudomonadota bacterium]|nr:formate--tetrahydrofolate ligase [Pseudomonadota bacterium]